MDENRDSRLRAVLVRLGLLESARALRRLGSGGAIRSFFQSLIRFGYNNVLTHVPIHWLRLAYLRHVLRIPVGSGSFVHMGCRFEAEGEGIRIGRNSVIGRACMLLGDIVVGSNVSITAETYIFTTSHVLDSPDFKSVYGKVVIGDRAWIGARAMILPNVTIGEGAVLAAASTATRPIPQYAIYAGAPAREIGKRSPDLSYTLQYAPMFQ